MTAPNALFDTGEPVVNPGVHTPGSPAALFADIVFDRPLDHAYTYAVPPHLAEKVGVGKRVEAPFGKGDRGTPGFCVRVTDRPPTREVKAVTRVLDDDALVDDHLMKLTRWMADYYLCGWGQVLHAVVPAGVRENAGTRPANKVTEEYNEIATQWFVVSDLGLSTMKGKDGLHVSVRSIADATPLGGVEIRLISRTPESATRCERWPTPTGCERSAASSPGASC